MKACVCFQNELISLYDGECTRKVPLGTIKTGNIFLSNYYNIKNGHLHYLIVHLLNALRGIYG